MLLMHFWGALLNEIPCRSSVVELPPKVNVEITLFLASTARSVAGNQVSGDASGGSLKESSSSKGSMPCKHLLVVKLPLMVS